MLAVDIMARDRGEDERESSYKRKKQRRQKLNFRPTRWLRLSDTARRSASRREAYVGRVELGYFIHAVQRSTPASG